MAQHLDKFVLHLLDLAPDAIVTASEGIARVSKILAAPCFMRQGHSCLVRQRIDHEVNSDANPQRRIFFGVTGIVRPFPGIADIGVE